MERLVLRRGFEKLDLGGLQYSLVDLSGLLARSTI